MSRYRAFRLFQAVGVSAAPAAAYLIGEPIAADELPAFFVGRLPPMAGLIGHPENVG